MSAVYLVSDKLVVAYQTAIARKKAHVQFLEERILAERKCLDEFLASLPEKIQVINN